MAKTIGGTEIALALLVVGGHSVGAALIEGHTKQAVLEALGVAAIAIIFMFVHVLINFVQKKSDDT